MITTNDQYLWGTLSIVAVVIILYWVRPYKEGFNDNRLYLGGPTKCFSCEKDIIARGGPTYLAQPTKCFDCEAQGSYTYGPWAAHFGQNNKCFSCESQYANNPFKQEQPKNQFGRIGG